MVNWHLFYLKFVYYIHIHLRTKSNWSIRSRQRRFCFFVFKAIGVEVFQVLFSCCCFLPFSSFYFLWKSRKVHHDPSFISRFGFFTNSYKARYFWWELVSMSKRFFLILLSTLLSSSADNVRSFGVIIVLFWYLFLESIQSRFQQSNRHNVMFFYVFVPHLWLRWSLLLILPMLSQVLVFTDTEADFVGFSAFMLLLIIFCILYNVFQVVRGTLHKSPVLLLPAAAQPYLSESTMQEIFFLNSLSKVLQQDFLEIAQTSILKLTQEDSSNSTEIFDLRAGHLQLEKRETICCQRPMRRREH